MTRFDLQLRHPSGVTPVLVGDGVLDSAAGELSEWVRRRRIFLISSPRVLQLHAEVLDSLAGQARDWVVLEVPDGEAAKSLGVAEDLWNRMLEADGKRDSGVIAFGGGSVGDLAGFVAGTYMRGVEYLQLPTTLLAQVDAAIGGKTAINLKRAKNSVGVFHHPQRVVADTRLLGTLPVAELRSGLVEVLKMAILGDPELFALLEADLERLLSGDSAGLAPVVAAAAGAKIEIVERDPTERGERMQLNLGHTLGHALEASLGYRFLRHGEAVGYGILFAVGLASRRNLRVEPANRIRHLVERFQLPKIPPVGVDSLIRLMRRDKKVTEAGWRWVLPSDIGSCDVVSDFPDEAVERELTAFVEQLQSDWE